MEQPDRVCPCQGGYLGAFFCGGMDDLARPDFPTLSRRALCGLGAWASRELTGGRACAKAKPHYLLITSGSEGEGLHLGSPGCDVTEAVCLLHSRAWRGAAVGPGSASLSSVR